MPTYSAQCSSCGNVVEYVSTISNRNMLDGTCCDVCQGTYQKMIDAVSFGDPVKLGLKKPDNSFKEVLQKIHSKTAGSQLD